MNSLKHLFLAMFLFTPSLAHSMNATKVLFNQSFKRAASAAATRIISPQTQAPQLHFSTLRQQPTLLNYRINNKPLKKYYCSKPFDLSQANSIWPVAPHASDNQTSVIKFEDAGEKQFTQTYASSSFTRNVKTYDMKNYDLLPEKKILKGHDSAVLSAEVAPDLKYIASSSTDGTIKIWNTSGKSILSIPRKRIKVSMLTFSQNGNVIAAGCADGRIRLINLETKHTYVFKEHTDKINALVFSADDTTLFSGSTDGSIIMWDLKNKKYTTLIKNQGNISALALSPDESTLATVNKSGDLIIWNLNANTYYKLIKIPGGVFSLKFSPNGNQLAFAGIQGHACIDLVEKKYEEVLHTTGPVYSIDWSPDGTWLVTGDASSKVCIWPQNKNYSFKLLGHTDPVRSVQISKNGNFIVSGSEDGTVRTWGPTSQVHN